MLFKHDAAWRHRIPRARTRVTNWPVYEAGLRFAQKTYTSGEGGYYSLLVVHRDSLIKSFGDLIKSAPGFYNLGNGDPNSTSGFLVPGYYAWAKNGVEVRRLFKNVVSANHTANLLAVVNKQVNVATNNSEDLEKFGRAQPERAAMGRTI